MDDETAVDRLTIVSDLGSLRFRPAVVVEAGSTIRVDGDVLVVRGPDGSLRQVPGERDERIPGRRYPYPGLAGQDA